MKGQGVIPWQGRILIYEPFNQGFRAHFLGEDVPQGISPELREAIEVDQRHQQAKALSEE